MLKATVAKNEYENVLNTVGDPECQCALEAEEALHMAVLSDAEGIKREEYAIAVLKCAMADMQDRIKVMQASVLRARAELAEACGEGNMYSGDTVSISWNHSTRVDVDMDALPNDWKRVKFEADKTAIKKALQSGESVDGAELVEAVSIRIA